MGYFINILNKLTRQLIPSGRAYKMPENSTLEKFSEATNEYRETIVNDIHTMYNYIFPDNLNFVEEDALRWERCLGLISNSNVDIEDRRKAITRKMNHPGTIKARQSAVFMEKSLNDAGFNVKVFENRFWDNTLGKYVTKKVSEIAISTLFNAVQHGQITHGAGQHGQTKIYKIANSIDAHTDLTFDVGDTLGHTFFISSNNLGINAQISEDREIEFRKLVLTLKPVHCVCFAFVSIRPVVLNYLQTEDEYLFLLEDDGNILLEDAG